MKRLECLDGLRGVLAVYVMLGHMAPFAAMPRPLGHALSHGGAAVDVFFILSGMVIFASLRACGWRAGPFLRARVFRIFPAYLAMLPFALGAGMIAADFASLPWIAPEARGIWALRLPPDVPGHLFAHLTMLHGLLPDAVLPDAWVSLLGAAWSLSTEWQFYLLVLAVGLAGGARGGLERDHRRRERRRGESRAQTNTQSGVTVSSQGGGETSAAAVLDCLPHRAASPRHCFGRCAAPGAARAATAMARRALILALPGE